MKEKILSVGSIIASFFASICCIGVPLLSVLGLGGLGFTLAPVISPYKNIFIALTILMLAGFKLNNSITSHAQWKKYKMKKDGYREKMVTCINDGYSW